MICEKCKPIELEAMRALESLTPSGSEFVNDPKRCVEFVRHSLDAQWRHILKLSRQVELESKISPSCQAIVPTNSIATEGSPCGKPAVGDTEMCQKHLEEQ